MEIRKVLAALSLVVLIGVANAEVVTFQQGVDGYEGTIDTYLRGNPASDGTKNYGSNEYISVAGKPWYTSTAARPGLLAFTDVVGSGAGQVPEGATINNVTLTVYGAGNATMKAYQFLTPWVEGNSNGVEEDGASCYSYRKFQADGIYEEGEGWGTATVATNGPVGGGADYGQFMWSNLFGGTESVYTADLTSIYASDISAISTGMFLVTDADWIYTWLRSSEYTDTAKRPLLTIDYNLSAELLPGDANRDGVVSAGDYASVQANFGNTGDLGIPGDANGDGVVSAGDYASVQANFGNSTTGSVVPEPTTIPLLAIFGITVIKRRRK